MFIVRKDTRTGFVEFFDGSDFSPCRGDACSISSCKAAMLLAEMLSRSYDYSFVFYAEPLGSVRTVRGKKYESDGGYCGSEK